MRVNPKLLAAALLLAASAARAAWAVEWTNIALGRPVTAAGVFGSSATRFPTLTDGIFLGRSTQWQSGTVWWNGAGASVLIDLGGPCELGGAIIQADDNDAYALDWHDPFSGQWLRLWSVPNYNIFGGVDVFGMQTRPNPRADGEAQWFSSIVVADAVRVSADAPNDGSFALSEIQIFGRVLPPCVADLDANRVVDTADVSLLLLDFGPCAGCASDLDGNGVTDTADVSLLLLDFGACPG